MPMYTLYWQEGHGFRSDPDPFHFRAGNDEAAFVRAASATGTQLKDGRLDKKAFRQAGAESLYKGGELLFPLPEGIEFRIAEHSEYPGKKLVEILLDGKVCAALYPQPDKSLKLVSAHFAGDLVKTGFPDGVTMDNGSAFPPIPAIIIHFDPRRYEIRGNTLIRHLNKK